MKRPLAFLLTMALLLGCFALLSPSADASILAGTCGDNLTWTKEDSNLTISGTGPMYDYSAENPAPWAKHQKYIDYVFIEDGVTSIGAYAFADTAPLRSTVASTVKKVGSHAFANCTRHVRFLCHAPEMAEDVFANSNITAIYVGGWDDTALQNYGGTVTWEKTAIVRMSAASKKFYHVGEPLKAENFVLTPHFGSEPRTFSYIPAALIAEYDNSTPGEKTVTVNLDGYEYTYNYVVTENTDLLSQIQVSYDPIQYYKDYPIEPTVTLQVDGYYLQEDAQFTLTYDNNEAVGTSAQITVTGIGEFAGYQKVLPFAILKRDLSAATFSLPAKDFTGAPITQSPTSIWWDNHTTSSYTPMYQNNINMGTAEVYLVGTGSYYGKASGGFTIGAQDAYYTLYGAYNGLAGGDLNDQVYLQEGILPPVMFIGRLDESLPLNAYYALYRFEGEEMVLVTEQQTEYANASDVAFTYDFRPVYENAVGGEVYTLVYSWVNSAGKVYSGALIAAVPAKVPPATSIYLEQAEGDGDFRCDYYVLAGKDGVLEDISWHTSDNSVAAVEDGIVTLKKPGTVTITGQSGQLTASRTLTVEALDLADAVILDHIAGVSHVIYDGRLLDEGSDYTMNIQTDDGITTVSVTGCGLFSGELVRQFSENGDAIGHNHSFSSACDETCQRCDFTRIVTSHQYDDIWSKDTLGHWHACLGCGKQADYAAHTKISDTACSVCGTLFPKGDVNMDMAVNRDDVIALLLHVSMPGDFPLSVSADYTCDGKVTRDDVIKLLLHISMPDDFPL